MKSGVPKWFSHWNFLAWKRNHWKLEPRIQYQQWAYFSCTFNLILMMTLRFSNCCMWCLTHARSTTEMYFLGGWGNVLDICRLQAWKTSNIKRAHFKILLFRFLLENVMLEMALYKGFREFHTPQLAEDRHFLAKNGAVCLYVFASCSTQNSCSGGFWKLFNVFLKQLSSSP